MKLTNLLFILFHDMQNAFENITVLLQRRWKLSNIPGPNDDLDDLASAPGCFVLFSSDLLQYLTSAGLPHVDCHRLLLKVKVFLEFIEKKPNIFSDLIFVRLYLSSERQTSVSRQSVRIVSRLATNEVHARLNIDWDALDDGQRPDSHSFSFQKKYHWMKFSNHLWFVSEVRDR